jgi:hypothetical protein
MNQALYAHMNNKRKMEKKINKNICTGKKKKNQDILMLQSYTFSSNTKLLVS